MSAEKSLSTLLLLCLCVVLSMTTWFSATAVMPQLQAYWNVTPQQSTWLAISVQLGFAIGAVGSAAFSLSDLVPPRILMAVSSAAVAMANLGILFAPDASSGIVLRTLTGVLLAGVYPPALKLISTWFRKGRGVALGSVIGALTLGSAMPHAINAFGGLDWRIVIVTTTIASLLAAFLMIVFLRDGPYPFAKTSFNPSQIKQALANRVFVLGTLGYLGHMWELYAMWTWLLFFVKARLVSSDIDSGYMASLLTFLIIAAGAPACIIAGAAADRIGRTAMTFILMVISGTCAATIGFTFDVPLWAFMVIGIIWGATVVADSAQFSTIVTEAGDPRLVGTSLTVQLGAGYALTVLAIWLLPMAEAWLGSWQWVFLFLVPGPVIGAAAMAALRRLPEATRIAHGRR
ncbi:MFS transporter [Methyloligella halotolerans]|uniref:MFS transporter n=1 Tax=Methyloligella halotolerans TaxID=1177755 RepID=UPI00083D738E|nr:MFS transporter [Methyloligella halotolerans]